MVSLEVWVILRSVISAVSMTWEQKMQVWRVHIGYGDISVDDVYNQGLF